MRRWFRCDAQIGEDPRFAKLPSDTARVAWILVLGKGKFQMPQGVWKSKSHVEAALGRRYGRWVDALLAQQLLVVDEKTSTVRIRKWPDWQSDLDYSTPRVARLRALKRGETA